MNKDRAAAVPDSGVLLRLPQVDVIGVAWPGAVHNAGRLERPLSVVEGIGERVRLRVVDAERCQPERVLGVSEDAREGGSGGVGITGPGEWADDDERRARSLRCAVRVGAWRHLVVEAAAVVPGDE